MSVITELSDYELRNTQEDLIEKRIIACFATNSTFLSMVQDLHKFTYTQGEPPKGKLLKTPGMFCWIVRERTEINSQGSFLFNNMEVVIRISLGNHATYKPFDMNDDGTYTEMDTKHTPLREARAIGKAMMYVLEDAGFDNDWYYNFVQQGVMGERGQAPAIDYDTFGGFETGSSLFLQYLTTSFTVQTWSDKSVQISTGDISVTVSDGAPVVAAKVWIKDVNGNTVEDSSGNNIWTTNGSGVATASDLVAQKGTTVYAESSDGSLTGNTASQLIPNTGTLTLTVTVS